MKLRMLVLVGLFTCSIFALAADSTVSDQQINPPSLQHVLAATKPDPEILSALFAGQAQLPLGPEDVLQEYEGEMTVISEKMSADLARVSQAVQSGEITRAEAEYLIQERYQTAMMQYQVLGALHDALQQDMGQHGNAQNSVAPSTPDTALVVKPPVEKTPASGQ